MMGVERNNTAVGKDASGENGSVIAFGDVVLHN